MILVLDFCEKCLSTTCRESWAFRFPSTANNDSSCIVGLGSTGQTSGQLENNIYDGLLDNRAFSDATDKELVLYIF